MKKQKFVGTNGKTVTVYIPESDEDVKKLESKRQTGRIDRTDYMHGEDKQKTK
jgi:hypothetical protein